MKFPRRLPHFRSIKFAPFALISLFLFSNLTGILFSRAMAPDVAASTEAFSIPSDIPSSGDHDIDRIIFEVGEDQGVDPRFIHAVIWQESKYKNRAKSHAGAQGLMQLMPATAKRFGCDDPDDPE
jgi:soluble lytic murein transglycosylase-like protein